MPICYFHQLLQACDAISGARRAAGREILEELFKADKEMETLALAK